MGTSLAKLTPSPLLQEGPGEVTELLKAFLGRTQHAASLQAPSPLLQEGPGEVTELLKAFLGRTQHAASLLASEGILRADAACCVPTGF